MTSHRHINEPVKPLTTDAEHTNTGTDRNTERRGKQHHYQQPVNACTFFTTPSTSHSNEQRQRLTVTTPTYHVDDWHVGVVAQSGGHGQRAADGVDVEELVHVGRFRLSTVDEIGDVTVITLQDGHSLVDERLSGTHSSTTKIHRGVG